MEIPSYLNNVKNNVTKTFWFALGKDRIGRRVFDGKKSCYYIPLTAGSFGDMTTFCKKSNMQMVILETLQDYRLLANIIKRGKNFASVFTEIISHHINDCIKYLRIKS